MTRARVDDRFAQTFLFSLDNTVSFIRCTKAFCRCSHLPCTLPAPNTLTWFQNANYVDTKSVLLRNDIFPCQTLLQNMACKLCMLRCTGWSKSLCAPDSLYSNNPHTIDDMKMAITGYIRNMDRAVLNTVFENTVRCVNKCLETGGGHWTLLVTF